MSLDVLSLDILLCIAERLCLKDFLALSRCSRSLHYLSSADYLWKQLCQQDFCLLYNDPDQLYQTLYKHTRQRLYGGRRPCHHLSSLPHETDLILPPSCRAVGRHLFEASMPIHADPVAPPRCLHCSVGGVENLLICAQPDCFKMVCERHSRLHARHCYAPGHSIFFKLNTAELFCQSCVDWLGGVTSDPAEQYKVRKLLDLWLPQMYPVSTCESVTTLQQKRRYERHLRWQDSPHQIILETQGVCFVPSRWMVHWELFVEGWRTMPPEDPIDYDRWRTLTTISDDTASPTSINFSPSSSQSSDLVVVSHQTRAYLLSNYGTVGPPISEDDLKARKMYSAWQQRLDLWKSRLLA